MNQEMKIVTVVLLLFAIAGCQTTGEHGSWAEPAEEPDALPVDSSQPYIDVHNHLYIGGRGDSTDYFSAGRSALETMGKLNINTMILMPPPRSRDNRQAFVMEDFLPVVRKHPGAFYYLGGGGSLNLMIHEAKVSESGRISRALEKRFKRRALEILDKGAIGFGELAVEHFSFSSDHPYESVAADHPLFLLLADIAAERKVPIDIHMEAVSKTMPLPDRKVLKRSKNNPQILQENVSRFERLLAHNRDTKIIWSHLGWCNTGARTVDLTRRLLEKHPNLFMSFKLSKESVRQTRPMGKDKSTIKPEWLALIREFPKRFMIGTDQFYGPPGERRIGPQKTESTRRLVSVLPKDLAVQVAVENPKRIFRLE